MNTLATLLRTAALSTVVCLGTVSAQETKKDSKPAADAQADGLPKPSPEHEMLKHDAGTWDATVESRMSPTDEMNVTKGVETNRVMTGGLWLSQSFKGEFGGVPFEGHGITGYDPAKKKYVGIWVDSMTPAMMTVEGTYDPKTMTMTSIMTGDAPGPDGKPQKLRSTTEYKADTRVFTMYMPGPDGKDFAMMKITYKRRLGAAKPVKQ